MEKTFAITISWWPSSDRQAAVPAEYQDALSGSGFDRAVSMAAEGFTSGELNDCVRLGVEGEPEDGVDFSGWWSVKEEDGDE